ncbi:acyl-protein synthetase LuxE [Pseudoalteromonas distincta]|uniref:LuxE/PaaK family acyltransferase n=1 Tax=Pseudoalteromonas TaxID=53246 RepID=UPI00020A0501|nr:acyl-protein synthetase LuxE [Pseudoalteromonas distincta]EGI73874.1 acyl-protein synthetase, LuxE [Pseudoalteromonas distincta]
MHLTDEQLRELPVYGLANNEKQAFLNVQLAFLDSYHKQYCVSYQRLQQSFADTMPLAVPLFKQFLLSSINADQQHRLLTSSGTSGAVSKISLDAQTAQLQSKILTKTLQHWLGKQRLPMLIIDAKQTVQKKSAMSARAAGIQGMLFFGRDPHFALNDDMTLNMLVIDAFFKKYSTTPVFIFGFTFIVWQQFIQALVKCGKKIQFEKGVLLHGGGWKKMQQHAVTNNVFKQAVAEQLGAIKVHDYYGMVEQTGTIYIECEHGFLHTPVWSDITIVDAATQKPLPAHTQGVIQVESVLAKSYPGHRLLTEDLGTLHGEDNCQCGRLGKYFTVEGRLAKSQVRGCSDTFI